jgi:hypothetical protein
MKYYMTEQEKGDLLLQVTAFFSTKFPNEPTVIA